MHKSLSTAFLLTAAMLFFVVVPCRAAGPDAGQLLREQKPKPQLPQQLPQPETPSGKQEQKVRGRILVKGFTFSGYQGLVSETELQKLVADSINKEHSFAQLQAVAAKVTRYLKEEKGWMLARAYLPQQDISSGIITIAVAQGKSDGSLNIEDDGSLRIRKERLRSMGEHGITKDQPISSRQLERSVLLMNDLPGITARASLAPGTTPGTTALTINASEEPLLTGTLWADNYGNRYTGEERVNTKIDFNDPFHFGDQAGVRLTASEHMQTGELNYSAPLSSNGLRGDISYTFLRYKLDEEFKSLDADGDVHTVNAGLTYPLIRSRKTNVYTSLQYEYKDLTDSVQNIDTSNKLVNNAILTAYGNHYDTFFGGGLTTWRTSATCGAMDERTADVDITGTQGGYTYFNGSLSRLQRLAQNLTLNLSWQAQVSLDNLASSEQFSLGGPYGVRAYPVSEGQGDQGHLFNVETRYAVPVPEHWGRLNWGVFYDAGYITLHKDTWDNAITTATGRNHYWLQGAGTQFEYSYNNRFGLTVSWAHTIGDNDGRSAEGRDSDGEQHNNRFWVQAVLRF